MPKPYAILSEKLQTTIHQKILFNVVLILLGQHCAGQNIYAMLSERLQTTIHKKILCNVVLALLGQYCTAQDPTQCCPRGSKQHCTR